MLLFFLELEEVPDWLAGLVGPDLVVTIEMCEARASASIKH